VTQSFRREAGAICTAVRAPLPVALRRPLGGHVRWPSTPSRWRAGD